MSDESSMPPPAPPADEPDDAVIETPADEYVPVESEESEDVVADSPDPGSDSGSDSSEEESAEEVDEPDAVVLPANDPEIVGEDHPEDVHESHDEAPADNTIDITVPPSNAGFVDDDTELVDLKQQREALSYLGEPEDVEVSFTIAAHLDPNRQKDPNGVYLDDVDRAKAEQLRARVEDREPDLDNPPAIASDVYMSSVAAAAIAPPGAVVPVYATETVNLGVPADDVTANSAAAAAQGMNPDGSPLETEDA